MFSFLAVAIEAFDLDISRRFGISASSSCLRSVWYGFIKNMLILIFSQVMKIINISQNERRGESTFKIKISRNQKIAE